MRQQGVAALMYSKWLKEQGVVFHEKTMSSAAEHGHVVRYLRAEGCPWDDDVGIKAHSCSIQIFEYKEYINISINGLR
jgi:hypothetical protein